MILSRRGAYQTHLRSEIEQRRENYNNAKSSEGVFTISVLLSPHFCRAPRKDRRRLSCSALFVNLVTRTLGYPGPIRVPSYVSWQDLTPVKL